MEITERERGIGLSGATTWALVGFGLYVAGAIGAFLVVMLIDAVVLAPVGIQAEAGLVGLSIRNALHPVAWGLLVAAVATPIGRRLVPEIRFSLTAWGVLATGLALTGATLFLLQKFIRARYVYFDTEYAGFSIFAWPAMVAIALAGWAALAVPRGQGALLGAAVVTAIVGLVVALVPSLPGAVDGIDSASIPLVAAFGADTVYAAIVGLLVVGRLNPAPPR